jgi:hypothetical protein
MCKKNYRRSVHPMVLPQSTKENPPLHITSLAYTQNMSRSNRTVDSEAICLMRQFENIVRAHGWAKNKPSLSEAWTWYSFLEEKVIGVLWISDALYDAQKVRGPEKTRRTVYRLLGRHKNG